MRPPWIIAIRSAIRRALAMSWVMVSAAAPSARTQSAISASIAPPMIGSSPVVGSSKNSTAGPAAIALASATRLRIPPDSSAGHRSAKAGPSPTRASVSTAASRASPRAVRRAWIRPKATFSQTGRESNSAPPWNSIP